jgi:L-2-hydroxyglutarate oxidase LhgO
MLVDHIIIGGGIIGLLVARELRKKSQSSTIVLFEKSPFLGDMATGRNSGVLHAGLYYPTNSLKHYHCLMGNQLWDELSRELDIYLNRCGKYVFATSTKEKTILSELYKQAHKNKVPNISQCGPAEIEALQSFVNIEDAFFSKSTGVLDIADAVKKLELWLEKNDVHLLKGDPVLEIKKEKTFKVVTEKESLTCQNLYNCAGGFAIDIRRKLGLDDFESYWVKGNYVRLKKEFYNKSLLYPVPQPELKGLGVHTVFGRDGIIYFGPDTEDTTEYDHKQSDQTIEKMYPVIKEQFKGIEISDLEMAYCGIRPKIKKCGNVYSDFFIGTKEQHGIDNYLEFLGVESPGLTAAPSLVKLVTQ